MDRRDRQQSASSAAGLFVILLAIVRACLQAITVDEASTYFRWVRAYSPWSPSAKNHVLNSLLMWVSTHASGRPPRRAHAGRAGSDSVCFYLLLLVPDITDRFSLQFPVFICLVYNPFILDFMVAARGYGLANAFLLAAIAIPIWHHRTGGPSLRKSSVLTLLALGLSFAANFSFAFVDVAVFFGIATWALRERGKDSAVRILGFCILPALFCRDPNLRLSDC